MYTVLLNVLNIQYITMVEGITKALFSLHSVERNGYKKQLAYRRVFTIWSAPRLNSYNNNSNNIKNNITGKG